MNSSTLPEVLLQSIREVVQQARAQVKRQVNTAMVHTYWQVGRLILEHEQQGKQRAAYGKRQLELLSAQLTAEFGKGFDVTNLRNMRRFYQAFPIRETVSLELSWSHYNLLSRIENPNARQWYQSEAAQQNWSVRALERQIGNLYYERLLSSRDKVPVAAEAEAKTTALASDPKEFLRDPDDNPTIGLILSSEHNHTVAQYSVLKDSQHLFASKYLTVLPSEEELQRELERERRKVEQKIRERQGVYHVRAS